MYGLLLNAAVTYLQQVYPTIYKDVLEELGFSEQRDLDQYQIYSDKLFGRITKLMSEKAGTAEDQLMESFGEYFMDYTVRVGYHDLLFSLGRTLSDLFNELDNLHEYIRFTYPKIKAPSFICLNESVDGITLLYRSRRKGFQSYVKGVLRGVSLKYYGTSINIDIVSMKEVGDRQEVVYNLVFDNSSRYASATGDIILRDTYFKNKVIMADTIFELYPFHILINDSMEILSVGRGLKQLFPKALREDFGSLFEIIRPDIEPNFRTIQHHLNNIFELNCILSRFNTDPNAQQGGPSMLTENSKRLNKERASEQLTAVPIANVPKMTDSNKSDETELILKGQMIYIDEWGCVMFIGFPLLMMPEQMLKIGLYLSDLSLFDSSRDLVMAAAQDAADKHLTQKLLSVKSDVVAEAQHMAEKAKEDWQRTHYAFLPPSVSQRLMRSEPTYAMTSVFERATVIAVDIIDERLHSGDKALFSLIEDVHKEAQTLCTRYDLFKVDGRLTEFKILAGVPDPINAAEATACRVAAILASTLPVRVGIATGPLATGVVGCKLLAYKPFGTALKMSRKLLNLSSVRRVLVDEATSQACSTDRELEVEPGADFQDAQVTHKTFFVSVKKAIVKEAPAPKKKQ